MKTFLLTICALLGGVSWSQTISTDAPSMTPSAEVIQPRVFQYEGRIQFNDGGYTDFPLNLFRIGLSKRWELRSVNGLNFSNGLKNIDITDIQLGTKFAIMEGSERKTKMALLAHYQLPTHSNNIYGLKYPRHSANMALAISHSLNEKSSLSYSFGFNYSVHRFSNGDDKNEYLTSTGSLAYTNSLSSKLNLFCEVYGNYYSWYYNALEITNSFNLDFDAGLYYQLRDHIQLDYTFGYGITQSMYFHSFGFDIMIAPKKD